MCLIIAQLPTAQTLTIDELRIGWCNNSDGAGFMYVADGKLIIEKPYRRLQKFFKAYERAHSIYGMQSPFVLHFRYATHGSKTKENTHPHPLASGAAGLVHNGILPIDPPHKSDMSDTVYFCQTVLGARPAAMLIDKEFGAWLANVIGKGNKFVILAESGDMSIINETAGLWDGSNWYSNSSYKELHRWTVAGAAGMFPASDGKKLLTCDSRAADADLWTHGDTNYSAAAPKRFYGTPIKLCKRSPGMNYVQVKEGEWVHIDDLPEDEWKKHCKQLDDAYQSALEMDDPELLEIVEEQIADMEEMDYRRTSHKDDEGCDEGCGADLPLH